MSPLVTEGSAGRGPVEPPTGGGPSGFGPRWLPTALVAAATLLALVAATTVWLRVQLLDTDR